MRSHTTGRCSRRFLSLRLALVLFVAVSNLTWSVDVSQAISAAGAVPGDGYPHPILSDVRVRRAIAYCTNRDALAASVYSFLSPAQRQTLMMDSFLPSGHWAHTTPSMTYAYNPTQGRQLLEDAGWNLAPGATYRTNSAGDELALSVTSTTAAFRATYLTALQTQLAGCGMRLTLNLTSASWWFGADTGLRRRDFEIGAFAWLLQGEPAGYTLYSCDYIPTPVNGWTGQNYMGWCNDAASSAIFTATHVLTRTARVAAYATVQEQLGSDMVSLQFFRRAEVYGTDRNLTGFQPFSTVTVYTWNANTWAIPGAATIVIAMTQEPASLFRLQDDGMASQLARALLEGVGFSQGTDHELQPVLYSAVPTVENGGIVMNPVTASGGMTVTDVSGIVAPLSIGMRVLNAAGNVVTYTGGTVSMPQAVITGSYRSGLRWSDGTPLVQADLELADRIQCDPAASRLTYYCSVVTARSYLSDTSVRNTLVPGYLPLDVTPFMPTAFPSQRTVSGGRLLKDVPAAEWPTLPEVTTNPIGLGPYRLTSREPGVRLAFGANPYYTLAAPVTPNIEMRLFQNSSTLGAQLISGQIDVVGSETGASASDIIGADTAGQVRAYVVASGTLEHMDINLAVYHKVRLPLLQK